MRSKVWALLDKRKVMKPSHTAALRVHHCQGREHPSVRETWCVSESETRPRGGRIAVGGIRRVCSIFCYILLCVFTYCMCVLFSHFFVVLLNLNKFLFLFEWDPWGRPRKSHHVSGESVTLPRSFIASAGRPSRRWFFLPFFHFFSLSFSLFIP